MFLLLLVGVGGCNEDSALLLPRMADGGVDLATAPDLVVLPDLAPLPPPRIDRVLPGSGSTSGGTPLSILGTGFQKGLTVSFDGVPSSIANAVDATHAFASTPMHAVGHVELTLRNPDGQEASARYHYVSDRPFTTFAVPADQVEPGLNTLVAGYIDRLDLKPDLAMTSAYASTLHIYYAARPFFGDRPGFPTCTFPVALAIADFNSDGTGDVAVACRQDGGVWIHIGDFSDLKLPVASPAVALAAGDLNGDKTVDLAVVDDVHARITLLFGDGKGAFAAGPVLQPGGSPYAVALGDLDGDGKLDLVSADAAKPGTLTSYRGDGKGGFTPVVLFPSPVPSTALHPAPAAGLALGDFDGDKRLDAAVAMGTPYEDYSAVMVLRQAALPGTPVVKRGFGSSQRPTSVLAADVDADGKLDLVVTDAEVNRIELLIGDGAGAFGSIGDLDSGNEPRQAALGDFNADGHLDLAHVNFRHGDLVVHPGGAAGFEAPLSFGGDGDAGFAVAADFDEDGLDDLAVLSEYDEWISVRLANGDGGFEPRLITPIDGASWRLLVGDFNGDHHLDLVLTPDIAMRMGRRIDLLLGQGDGTFKPGTSAMVNGVRATCAADFDGDGRSDLFVSGEILPGKADGSFGDPLSPTFLNWMRAYGVDGVLCRDLDGDGDPDLVSWDTMTMTLDVLLNQGHGTFAVGLAPPANTNGLPLLGDVNGDGKIDLVTVGETIHVLLGTGQGSFAEHDTAPNLNPLAAPQLLDLDGDGSLDLVLAHDSTRHIVVGYGNLQGRFSDGPWRRYGAVPLSAAMMGPPVVGHFDGSGKALMAVPTNAGAILLPPTVAPL